MAEASLLVRGVEPDEVEKAMTDLELEPEESLEHLDPLAGVVIVGAALAAAQFLIRIWHEFRGGTVIDLTKTPVDVSRDRGLDWGFFMFIAKDGTVTVEGKDEPKTALERMVNDILKLATTVTVETAKAAIVAAVGQDAKVKTEPAPAA